MKVAHRFQAAIAAGQSFHWQTLRDQLDAEHASSQDAGERESLLALFKTLMDMVELIDITPGLAAAFIADRRDSYHRMVLREAGTGGRCPVRSLDEITAREVKAGRMPEDDPLREAAILAVVALYRTQIEPASPDRAWPGDDVSHMFASRNWWHSVWAWFVRSNRRPVGSAQ